MVSMSFSFGLKLGHPTYMPVTEPCHGVPARSSRMPLDLEDDCDFSHCITLILHDVRSSLVDLHRSISTISCSKIGSSHAGHATRSHGSYGRTDVFARFRAKSDKHGQSTALRYLLRFTVTVHNTFPLSTGILESLALRGIVSALNQNSIRKSLRSGQS